MAHAVKHAPFIVYVEVQKTEVRKSSHMLKHTELGIAEVMTGLPDFCLLSFLFYPPLIQCCRISLGVGHVLGIGNGKVVGAAEVGLSTHI